MKRLAVLLAVLCVFLSGCAEAKYKEADFLGKTSAQIEAEFGAFDCTGKHADKDGLYRNTSCGYTIQEPRAGFFGRDPEVLFFVSFDENGVADQCYEGYRPGG